MLYHAATGASSRPPRAPVRGGVCRPYPQRPRPALIGPPAFFTSFPFIHRFCLDSFAPEPGSGTPSATSVCGRRARARTKPHYYTGRRGNLPCRLRPIVAPSFGLTAFGVRRSVYCARWGDAALSWAGPLHLALEGRRLIARGVNPWMERGRLRIRFSPGGATVSLFPGVYTLGY